jgi:hypothetical protein
MVTSPAVFHTSPVNGRDARLLPLYSAKPGASTCDGEKVLMVLASRPHNYHIHLLDDELVMVNGMCNADSTEVVS